MKKYMAKGLITLSTMIAGLSGVAEAATYTGTIIRMTNDWTPGYYILELNGVLSPCTYGGFTIPVSNTQYKDIVATAMLAFSLGKTVNVTTDANQTCQNGRVTTIAVQINY